MRDDIVINVVGAVWRNGQRSVSAAWSGTIPVALIAGVTLAMGLGSCDPRQFKRNSVDQALAATRTEPQYRRMVLENEMKVILISDLEADRSAASLSVGVGSLSDGPYRPGMAHFLEHMLFLGTKKYPEPEGYQSYIQQHAGSTNAYTADDHTNYFFQVSHEGFPEALDRFAQFFIAPLMNAEYVVREVNAVASEHSKNLENDGWRSNQVVRGAFAAGHPIARFSTGNLETLGGVTREEMLAYYQNQYSANLMTLAVIGNRSLDELEALARPLFAQVENHDLTHPRFPSQLLEKKSALRVISIEPIADQRTMTLTFPLPTVTALFREKPISLLAFILGHEGEGSLLSLLKEENLATSLGAGRGESTLDYATFNLHVGLTPEGLERYQEILLHVFSAIEQLRRTGVPYYVFEENQVMAALEFRYKDKGSASSRVTGLSVQMQSLPLAVLPEGVFHYEHFAPEVYQELLAELTPDNLLVTLVAQDLPPGSVDSTEPYYGTRYGYREFTGDTYDRIAEAPQNPALGLPAPNPFIPHVANPRRPVGPVKLADTTYLQLLQEGVNSETVAAIEPLRGKVFPNVEALVTDVEVRLTEEHVGQSTREAGSGVALASSNSDVMPALLRSALPLPLLLQDDDRAKVWYQGDWRFRQPKAQMILRFRTGNTYGSPRESVLAELYAMAWEEGLNEFGYPVRLAGLAYGLGVGKRGVTLTLGGFAPRMLELLNRLAGRLSEISISEQTFAALKERYRRDLQNRRFAQPYQQDRYYREWLSERPTFSYEEIEAQVESVTLAEVQSYAEGLYDRVFLEAVVVGNVAPVAVRMALEGLLDILAAQPLPAAERNDPAIVSLPPGADYVFTRRLDINNSLVSVAYEVGETNPTLRGGHLIIGKALRDSFYFNMRTQQQLGYIVFSGMGQMRRMLGLYFLVQSGAYTADTLQDRVDAFIPSFVDEFKALPADVFERYRDAVIDAKLQRSKSLAHTAERLMWVAFEYDEKFDHVSEDIRAVEQLSRQEVNAMVERSLRNRDSRRLLIRLIGKDHAAQSPRGTPIDSAQALGAAG